MVASILFFVTKCVYKSIKFGVTQTVEQKETDAQRVKLTLAMRPKEQARIYPRLDKAGKAAYNGHRKRALATSG